jgi:hypothetical protein
MGEGVGGGGQNRDHLAPSPSSPPTRGGEIFKGELLEGNSQIPHIRI